MLMTSYVAGANIATRETLHWPDLCAETFDKQAGPPKVDAIKSLFWIVYKIVEPYLDRDM